MIRKAQPVMRTLLAILLLVSGIAGCDVSGSGDDSENSASILASVHLSGPTMGTWYNVTIISSGPIDTARLSTKIDTLLAQLNSLMSTYDPQSELSRFNLSPINTPFKLSLDTANVLKMALSLSETTLGAFDVTVGPAVNLWGFGPSGKLERKPSESALAEALEMVGYNALKWSGERALTKTRPVYVDLSAIAKGYAVDKVAELLIENGYPRFLVDIGGELKAGAPKAPGQEWSIAVEKPTVHQRAIQQVVSLTNTGVATSGDYRNFYEFDGQRFSHAIDPRTGAPVNHSLASVSVLHTSVAYADGMATALMVLGLKDGLALAKSLSLPVYFIEKSDTGFSVTATDEFLNYIKQ